jgi:hypothetical protein
MAAGRHDSPTTDSSFTDSPTSDSPTIGSCFTDSPTTDMLVGWRMVPADEAARLAEEHGIFFSKVSALTGNNLERAFLTLLGRSSPSCPGH